MSAPAIGIVRHGDLASQELEGLRELFDSAYLTDCGSWDPEQPYGYAPHDVHIVARAAGRVIGHVGWARREIVVGSRGAAERPIGRTWVPVANPPEHKILILQISPQA